MSSSGTSSNSSYSSYAPSSPQVNDSSPAHGSSQVAGSFSDGTNVGSKPHAHLLPSLTMKYRAFAAPQTSKQS